MGSENREPGIDVKTFRQFKSRDPRTSPSGPQIAQPDPAQRKDVLHPTTANRDPVPAKTRRVPSISGQ